MLTERERRLIECIQENVTSNDGIMAGVGEFVLSLGGEHRENLQCSTDTERLDWVDSRKADVFERNGRWSVDWGLCGGGSITGRIDLREALDAAMKAEKGE